MDSLILSLVMYSFEMSTPCEFISRITPVRSAHFLLAPSFDFGDFTDPTKLTMGNPYVKVTFPYLMCLTILIILAAPTNHQYLTGHH